MRKVLATLAAITLSSCSMAMENTIKIPVSDSQRMIADNLTVTVKSLSKAYMSSDLEQRRLAEMYVIGVLDSTEGQSWCGFNVASPDAIQEQVFAALRKAAKASPEKRASTAIESHLTELLPCKDTQ